MREGGAERTKSSLAPGSGASVSLCTVTWNSREQLEGYFAALETIEAEPGGLEVILVDCASEDGSFQAVEQLRQRCRWPLRVFALEHNAGFAGGMNHAIAESQAEWIWALNPDARPEPGCLSQLLRAAREHLELRFGAVTPRIVRDATGADQRQLLDACGMRLTRTWRHLDRASGEVDRGQLSLPERVFGGTGAATFYRREALDDVAVEGQVFDRDFHSYREDAELAFRLQERGWECLYAPQAVVRHKRFNLPERRSSMPAHVNRHSLKNRYLLRLYHQTLPNFGVTFLPALWRDLLALGHVLLREQTSLAAYGWLWQNRRRLLQRRRLLVARRSAPRSAVDRWFSHQALPLPQHDASNGDDPRPGETSPSHGDSGQVSS